MLRHPPHSYAGVCIPFRCFSAGRFDHPLRFDVFRILPWQQPERGEVIHRWMNAQPWPFRLGLRTDNPSALGWLEFE